MRGRVIQSSAPIRLAIVDGLDVRDSRVHNYPPRWNGAPSQELLVIRRNHDTSEVSLDPLRWGLIPYWCQDPKGGRKPINAKSETVANLNQPSVTPIAAALMFAFMPFPVSRITGEADRQSVVFWLISFPNVGTPINSRSPIRISSSLTSQPFFLF